MFSKTLSDLSLANDIANNAFWHIRGSYNNDDRSFVATLRALLLPRVGDDKIKLDFSRGTFSDTQIRDNPLKAIINASFGSFERGSLLVHSAEASRPESRKALFDAFDEKFVKECKGFQELTNIKEFVAPVMNARFYTNEESQISVVLVESMSMRKWHYIQSFIPRYFKWYFADKPLTTEETALLASLTRRSPDEYERLIEGFAKKFDMRTFLVKNVFGDLERRSRKNELDRADRELHQLRESIEELEMRYAEAIKELDSTNIRRLGLLDIINNAVDGESELIDYVMSNKSIEPISSNDTEFDFIVKTYLDTWDPNLYEKMTKNPRSNLFCGYNIGHQEFEPKENRKKFLDAIYSDDPLLKIKMCGYYKLSLRGDCSSRRNYKYPRGCDDYMANPHLQIFACLGNHASSIRRYLRDGNTMLAIEQCIASCKSMNLTESQTFQPFFEILFKTDRPVIELPDGTSVSPVEAMNWLLEQEKGEKKDA